MVVGVVLFLTLVICVAYLRSPQGRGKMGEWKVAKVISKSAQGRQYVLHNYIIGEKGKTSQIDHIVINPHGIFVIETKNYSGMIYGIDGQPRWTQVLLYGKIKHKLYNPVKQNETHVRRIGKVLTNLPIYSVVVFVQNNTENIHSDNVISLKQLKECLNTGRNVLSYAQMEESYNKLLGARSSVKSGVHTSNIVKRKRNLKKGICPSCGGMLILRNGKYGQFYGCSNYPKCKFIKKIE